LTAFLQQWYAFSMLSVSFIYVFLPLSLFCYYVLPNKLRPPALLLISLVYLFLVQPIVAAFLAAFILLDYLAIHMMECYGARKFWLCFAIVKNLAILPLAALMTLPVMIPLLAVVYVVSSLDGVLAFYRREELSGGHSIANFGLHCVFFPRLYAGPLQPYREFAAQLGQVHFNSRSLLVGFGQFVQGGLKLTLIARQCAELFVIVSGFNSYDITVLSLWSAVILFGFWLYFTLSGYCDMAQGIGAMFGIFLPKNFYYPYQSPSIGDFFERFNMTLSAFLKRNIYDPLAKSSDIATDILGMLLMGVLFGIWFGPRMNYLLWGVFLTIFALIGRYLPKKLLSAIPVLIRRIFTFAAVLLSFALMTHDSARQGVSQMLGMLGLRGHAFQNELIMYQIISNLFLLILAAFLCTSAINLLIQWAQKSIPRIVDTALAVINIALLVIFTAIIY